MSNSETLDGSMYGGGHAPAQEGSKRRQVCPQAAGGVPTGSGIHTSMCGCSRTCLYEVAVYGVKLGNE